MQVFVRDNNVDQALKALKREVPREDSFGEMRRRRSYEKPSDRGVRERAEAVDRHRKAVRKRLEREGY
jgi:small subunit ribosomal protein S21